MAGKHTKRRKDKYNPYTIWEVDKHYYISFKDGQGRQHEMEISHSLYKVFDAFELLELSYLNEWDRHIEHSELREQTLNDRAVKKPKTVEEIVIQNVQISDLRKAIGKLPEIQRRRLVLYYFGGFTYEQAAVYEKCSYPAVLKSVKTALKKIKKILSE